MRWNYLMLTKKKFLFDKGGFFKLNILRSPIFLTSLGLKLVASALFASNFLTHLFAPFVNYFVESGFQNPYSFFHGAGITNAFPYPRVMLWIMSIPKIFAHIFISRDYTIISSLDIFLYRLPILVADIIICVILARWLKNHEKKVLWFYWCSPILFYINYIHGQLDVIPIALLFVSLYFLFKERWHFSSVFLGFSLASKTHIAIVLPFIAAYLIRKKRDAIQVILPLAVALSVFVIINYNYFFSPEFIAMVFGTKEQFKVFDLRLPFNSRLVLYLAPLAYFILFLKSLVYRTYNRDIFVMFLGFSFGILTLFIPPGQGWYYWILPFLIYFYIKERNTPSFNFVALNVAYFLYFFLMPQSDFFQVFQLVSSAFAAAPNSYGIFSALGLPTERIVNTAFSILQGTLLVNIWWIYKRGVESATKHKLHYKPYLIGISGDSGSGKTTLAGLIKNVFGGHNTTVIAGDDMHKWERRNEMWQKMTHLNPRANDLHSELDYLSNLKNGESIERRHYDHSIGKFILPKKLESKKVVIFEGLHALFLNAVRNALDFKIFMKPDENLRLHWKVSRDIEKRGYSREKALEDIKKRAEDSENYIKTQEPYSDLVITLKNKHSIGDLAGGKNVPIDLYFEINCSNDLNLEPVCEILKAEGVEVSDNFYNDQRRAVQFYGELSPPVLDKITFALLPELWDITGFDPVWESDHRGLIQIVTCYCIFEKMKTEKTHYE